MKIESFLARIYSFSPSDFLLHLPDALPAGVSLTQALCQNPYPDSPTAVQALKVDFHHGYHASPRTDILSSGYFHFWLASLYVTGFTRCHVYALCLNYQFTKLS